MTVVSCWMTIGILVRSSCTDSALYLVAGGSVGWGSSVTGLPLAWLGTETFLAFCGIPHVVHSRLD